MNDQPEASDPHLIVATDPDARIEKYPEDWLAFAIFWGMAIVVFLQFFTRYVLNNSLAWTEEISRYLLMWVTFIGAAIAMRRRTHISVEVLQYFLPPAVVRPLRFAIDLVVLLFCGLLCWFAITVTQRMQIQTMTVIEVSMSVVYGGVALGCFLLLFRALQVFYFNARRGWRADPNQQTLIVD